MNTGSRGAENTFEHGGAVFSPNLFRDCFGTRRLQALAGKAYACSVDPREECKRGGPSAGCGREALCQAGPVLGFANF